MKNSFHIKIVSSVEEARHLWTLLSPAQTIYDLWDFRFCFYQPFQFPLYFYVGFIKEKPVGLLPLQFNTNTHVLEFFGGEYMENNKLFINATFDRYIPRFFEAIEKECAIDFIEKTAEYIATFPLQDYRYDIDIRSFQSYRDFIESRFDRKRKKNLKNEIKKIEQLSPNVITDRFADIEILFDLNIRSFGAESFLTKPHSKDIFRALLHLPLQVVMVSIDIAGTTKAASLALKYNDIYTLINSGSMTDAVPNLGKYLFYQNIDQALLLKASIFDAGVEDLGWKEFFHFHKVPQYMYYKKDIRNDY